jgi:hypothetical protein
MLMGSGHDGGEGSLQILESTFPSSRQKEEKGSSAGRSLQAKLIGALEMDNLLLAISLLRSSPQYMLVRRSGERMLDVLCPYFSHYHIITTNPTIDVTIREGFDTQLASVNATRGVMTSCQPNRGVAGVWTFLA